MGNSSINGPFSMAMLNNQRVYDIITHTHTYIYCLMISKTTIGRFYRYDMMLIFGI